METNEIAIEIAQKKLINAKYLQTLAKQQYGDQASEARKNQTSDTEGVLNASGENSSLHLLQSRFDDANEAVDVAKAEYEKTLTNQASQQPSIESKFCFNHLCPGSPHLNCFMCADDHDEAPVGGPQQKSYLLSDKKEPPPSSLLEGCCSSITDRFRKRPTYPRKLLFTLIGASQLPKLHTFGWCDPYVVVENGSTMQREQSCVINNNSDPIWDQTYTFEISDPSNSLKLDVLNHDIIGADDLIGTVVFHLDTRFIENREVALEIMDQKRRRRGVLRVAAVWEDEHFSLRERGRFYYRVVFPHGIFIRSSPSAKSKKKGTSLRPGEVFEAYERYKALNETTTYVRINPKSDRWMRSGWVFERLAVYDENGKIEQELQVLEAIQPPKQITGAYFYRVLVPLTLPLEPSRYSKTFSQLYPENTILECSEKKTPAGSDITFAKVDGDQGYILENSKGDILSKNAQGPLLEPCNCPEGVPIKEPEERKFYFKVVCKPGVYARKNPNPGAKRNLTCLLSTGQVIVADQVLTLAFAGLGIFRFAHIVKKEEDVLELYRFCDPSLKNRFADLKSISPEIDPFPWDEWVRLEKNGVQILKEVKDVKETGTYYYKVLHENGLRIRKLPNLGAKYITEKVIPYDTVFTVSERIVKAEDLILCADSTPVFLQVKDGWVFDAKDGAPLCRQTLPSGKTTPQKSFQYLKDNLKEMVST